MAFSPILAVFSLLYALVMRIRVWCYDVGVLPSDSSGAFVVSVGNIQAGGTGKTPIVDFLARRWSAAGRRLGVVSRGYNRRSRGSWRVDPSLSDASSRFGDEPTWLAQRLQDVPVQVGEHRLEAARDLIASEGTKLILLDDGFQHLALRRSFDIVLIDVTAPSWHWHVLPWGRLRESVSALKRADAIFLTKTESQSAGYLSDFEQKIGQWAGVDRRSSEGKAEKLPILRFSQHLSWTEPRSHERLVLAAGLARPESFFEMVRAHSSKPEIVQTVTFRDHHIFTQKDVMALSEQARRLLAPRVLVTEKDAVKLRHLWSVADVELAVSRLEVRPSRESDEKQLERLDEIILSKVRGGSDRSRGNSV